MSLLKNIYIKVLGLALLVALTSYSGVESQMLPQQYTSEHVVYTNVFNGVTDFIVSNSSKTYAAFDYSRADFQEYLKVFNQNQKSVFKQASVIADLLKESQQRSSFLVHSLKLSKDIHTSFI